MVCQLMHPIGKSAVCCDVNGFMDRDKTNTEYNNDNSMATTKSIAETVLQCWPHSWHKCRVTNASILLVGGFEVTVVSFWNPARPSSACPRTMTLLHRIRQLSNQLVVHFCR